MTDPKLSAALERIVDEPWRRRFHGVRLAVPDERPIPTIEEAPRGRPA